MNALSSSALRPRALSRLPLRVGLAALLAAASSGCNEPPPEPAKPAAAKAPSEPKRPPFPNMATAAWGAHVIEERADRADAELSGRGYKAALEVALKELHSIEAGSEARAADAAVAAWRAAQSDAERATGAALLGAALALEPGAEGFKERLTDAHGLAAYAATLEPGTVLSQCARAFVAIAAGRVFEGKKLVDVISGGPGLDPDAQLFLGLSRLYLAERSDAAMAPLAAVLKDKPESARARGALAEMLLDLGLSGLVLERLTEPGATTAPYLDALKGRALVLEGKADEGIALLRAAESKLPEARRGLALHWLGRSLTQGRSLDEATTVLGTLAARPGYASEAALLDALLAQLKGDFARAKKLAEDVCAARGVPLSLAVECQWTLVDACAGLGEAACVESWGKRATGTDGDLARLALARAALGLVGKAEGVDVDAALRQAHLLSPFDAKLAARLKLEAVPGGPAAAGAVRAARQALRMDANAAAARALLPLVEKNRSCRVCRALYAQAARDVDEGARRALKALDGRGPPLAEEDLLPLIDNLGGSPVKGGEAALEKLAKDARPAVQKAALQALADLKDPEARKRREEEKAHGHDEGQKAPPGSAPVPSLAPPPPPGENP